jgi:hypothetical protein
MSDSIELPALKVDVVGNELQGYFILEDWTRSERFSCQFMGRIVAMNLYRLEQRVDEDEYKLLVFKLDQCDLPLVSNEGDLYMQAALRSHHQREPKKN